MLRKGKTGWRLAAAVVLAVLSVGFCPGGTQAKEAVHGAVVDTVAIAELPVQGRNMVKLIYQGGPFNYDKDGSVFGNRERILPAKTRSYYREYTVLPPAGSPSDITVGGQRFRISPPQGRRGAERLIIGGGELLWYSPDHYKTFIALRVLP